VTCQVIPVLNQGHMESKNLSCDLSKWFLMIDSSCDPFVSVTHSRLANMYLFVFGLLAHMLLGLVLDGPK
jgi:hypothetical protein